MTRPLQLTLYLRGSVEPGYGAVEFEYQLPHGMAMLERGVCQIKKLETSFGPEPFRLVLGAKFASPHALRTSTLTKASVGTRSLEVLVGRMGAELAAGSKEDAFSKEVADPKFWGEFVAADEASSVMRITIPPGLALVCDSALGFSILGIDGSGARVMRFDDKTGTYSYDEGVEGDTRKTVWGYVNDSIASPLVLSGGPLDPRKSSTALGSGEAPDFVKFSYGRIFGVVTRTFAVSPGDVSTPGRAAEVLGRALKLLQTSYSLPVAEGLSVSGEKLVLENTSDLYTLTVDGDEAAGYHLRTRELGTGLARGQKITTQKWFADVAHNAFARFKGPVLIMSSTHSPGELTYVSGRGLVSQVGLLNSTAKRLEMSDSKQFEIRASTRRIGLYFLDRDFEAIRFDTRGVINLTCSYTSSL